jgi:hypothetical protein
MKEYFSEENSVEASYYQYLSFQLVEAQGGGTYHKRGCNILFKNEYEEEQVIKIFLPYTTKDL